MVGQNFSFPQHKTLPAFLSSCSRSHPAPQFENYAKEPTEIAKYYGCGVNKKSMENLYYRNVKPEVDLIKGAVANGQDPPELGQGHSKGNKSQIKTSFLLQHSTFSFCLWNVPSIYST